MRINYLTPAVAVITVSPKGTMLQASKPAGARSQGFQTAGAYDDDDWDIE